MLSLRHLYAAPVHSPLGLEPLHESAGAAADVEHVRDLRHEDRHHNKIDANVLLRDVWSFGGKGASLWAHAY